MKDLVPDIACLGMNHKTASVELREKLAIHDDDIQSFYFSLLDRGAEEAVLIKTCNRTELYIASHNMETVFPEICTTVKNFAGYSQEDFDQSMYQKLGNHAVQHLFSVVSSLDSMVIGENEITGQVKTGYREAASYNMPGPMLNKLFHASFRAAKDVRNKTAISQNPLSVASIAVDKAREIFPRLEEKSALLIGAGEMGELILRYFDKASIGSLTIANRSVDKARAMAEELATAVETISLAEIESCATMSDIIISSTTAPHHIITEKMAIEFMAQRDDKPLFIIDIAIPRNVDPRAGDIDGLFLFNVDDLQEVASRNMEKRTSEVDKARKIIDEHVKEFDAWYVEQAAKPTILSLHQTFDTIRTEEVQKSRETWLKHLSEEDMERVNELTRQIMNKTLHNPITRLKRHHMEKTSNRTIDNDLKLNTRFLKELFSDEDA